MRVDACPGQKGFLVVYRCHSPQWSPRQGALRQGGRPQSIQVCRAHRTMFGILGLRQRAAMSPLRPAVASGDAAYVQSRVAWMAVSQDLAWAVHTLESALLSHCIGNGGPSGSGPGSRAPSDLARYPPNSGSGDREHLLERTYPWDGEHQ